MAIGETSIVEKKMEAGAAVDQFRAVKMGADDEKVVEATALTDVVVGISQNAAVSGETVRIMVIGISRVKIVGAVTRGQRLRATTDGKFTAAASGNKSAAIAVKSGASNDVIPAIIIHGVE